MKDHEQTLEQSREANQLTAKLIDSGADAFDITIAQRLNRLTNQICQHRNINRKAAKKIVVGYIEVNPK